MSLWESDLYRRQVNGYLLPVAVESHVVDVTSKSWLSDAIVRLYEEGAVGSSRPCVKNLMTLLALDQSSQGSLETVTVRS